MGAVALILACFSAIPEQYLMTGRIESGERSFPFVVALSAERALVGRVGANGKTIINYTGAHRRRLQIEFAPRSQQSFAEFKGSIEFLLLTDSVVDQTPIGHRNAVQMAAYSKVRFPLFFSSEYHGIDFATLTKGAPFKNECGVLRTEKGFEGGLESIVFEQEESDLLTVRLPGQTLAQTTHPYPEGRKHIFFETKFTPSFDGTQKEWVADCTWECLTRDNEIHREETRVLVEEFVTDVSEIDRRMDQYLALIPNGEPVKAHRNDPLSYVWKDGKVVRYVDQPAVAAAAEAQFHRATSRRWIYLVLIFLAIATVLFLLARRPSAK